MMICNECGADNRNMLRDKEKNIPRSGGRIAGIPCVNTDCSNVFTVARGLRGQCEVAQWTSDAPTEAGFYWLKGDALHMVRVYRSEGDARLWVQYRGTEYEETVDNVRGCEWRGPVLPS